MISLIKPVINEFTRLCDVPHEWSRHFEWRIYRGREVDPCWVWIGTNMSGRPICSHLITGEYPVSAARQMLSIFFDFEEKDYNARRIPSCNRMNCMNPNHFVLKRIQRRKK